MSSNETHTFVREVRVDVSAEGDGRTLVSRLVPYNELATVNDGEGPYQETFLPGAFDSQTKAASRIKAFLNFRQSKFSELKGLLRPGATPLVLLFNPNPQVNRDADEPKKEHCKEAVPHQEFPGLIEQAGASSEKGSGG